MASPAEKRPPRPATYDDLRKVPDHLVAEIVGGELFTSPRTASPHARASSMMGGDLTPAFDRESGGPQGPGGWIILDEPELHLHGSILVPDLAGWRRERMPKVPNVAAFELAPDWVCEVVSPHTARLDRVRKMPAYARERVTHLWLVDPIEKVLEVYRLSAEGQWIVVANYGADDKVRAEPFDAIEIALARWWLEETPPETPPQ